MARKSIIDTYYTFTPATRTIVIPRAIPRERLVLITDVTTNQVIYNFSDANLKATSYNIATDPTGAYTSTTIVLNYNTTSLQSTDKLAIIVDEYDEKFTPSETYLDAVNKLRVSQPQSLVDTDYEYSTQATKWENLAAINNRPFGNFDFSAPITYTDILATQNSRTYTVNTTTPPAVGQIIVVIDSLYAGADGIYIVDSVVAGTSASYTGKFYYTGAGSGVSINNPGVTAVYKGNIFSGAQIPLSTITNSGTTVTVTTSGPHGLLLGNDIAITGTTATTNAPNGSWTVASVTSPTTFVIYVTSAPTGSIAVAPGTQTIQTVTGSKSVGVQSATAFALGQSITGTGIAANTYVTQANTATFSSASVSTTTLTVTTLSAGTMPQSSWPMNVAGISPTTAYVQYQLTSTASAVATIAYQANTLIPATTGNSVIPLANVSGVLVGQLIAGTNVPSGTYVGAVYTATGQNAVSLVNYLGAAALLTGTASGNYNFYTVGTTGTYQLSASTTGTPTAAYSFGITVPATATGSVTATPLANLYVKPSGHIAHRPYDGGVRFSTNAASHNHQFTRQTRRYFRYQSGKAIQMSTGTTLKPQMAIDALTSSGTTVTVTTKDPHNIVSGVTIQIAGANEPQYNGQFQIASVLSPYQFTYTALTTPFSTVATGLPVGSTINWYGNQNRVGIFDIANGMFFEYDGQTLWAVVRTSTYQLAGSIAVNTGSNTVNAVSGFQTYFSKQLQPGDFVVIKGSSYRVMTVNSDSQITINPGFRGVSNLPNTQIMKTTERRIPQSAFNIDRLDGTGPSGMTLDLSRMQMYYIDYSWYGTGFIRFGLRGSDGNVVYVHRFLNNNSQYLAYMRSGNLPGRYESNTFAKTSLVLPNTGIVGSGVVNAADSFIYVSDTYGWPTAGSAAIRNATQTEYINYTGINAVATLTFNTTAGSTTLTGTSTAGVVAGQYISGPNIPSPCIVEAVTTTSITISQPSYVNSLNQTYRFNPQLTGVTRAQAGGTPTGNTTTGSTAITGLSTLSGLQVGQYVFGSGIPNQAYITNINAGTNTVTISQAATATASTVSLIFAAMAGSAQTWTITPTALTSIELHAPQFASEVNHWGTSAIMDGQFTNDKQFIFTKGMTNLLSIPAGTGAAVLSFRVSPSASNGIPAQNIGLREIITRMQFIMQQTDILTNGNFLMTLVLNGTIVDTTSAASLNWLQVGGSSLSQYIIHNPQTTVTGGETIFGFYLNTGAGGTSYQSTQQDLTAVRDLGTSILGGGYTSPVTGIYPDGPDVITIVAQNLGYLAANIQARLSWVEAQA